MDRLERLTELFEAKHCVVCQYGETIHQAAERIFGEYAYPDLYDAENPEKYIGVVSEYENGPLYGVFKRSDT